MKRRRYAPRAVCDDIRVIIKLYTNRFFPADHRTEKWFRERFNDVPAADTGPSSAHRHPKSTATDSLSTS